MSKFEDVLGRWQSRELTLVEAGELVGVSERQFRRYVDRWEAEGLAGLRDGRLGRAAPNRTPDEAVAALLSLYRRDYMGWNVAHFHEHAVKRHGFTLSYSTVKNRLQDAGLVRVQHQKGVHRRKRERKPCVGMMLHQDASRHAWLEGETELDLVVTLDDATGAIYSAFLVEEEGTLSSFRGLLETFLGQGVPASLYTDRGSHYFMTLQAGGPVDKERPTQVGRALARLGVTHIPAYSPQARGRSERAFGTLQDRLPKELKLAGIRDVASANAWIGSHYIASYNASFAQAPALPESAFTRLDPGLIVETLAIEEDRVVGRDNTVAWEGRRLQLPESPLRRHWVGCAVKVHVYPDGGLAVLHGPRPIARYTADGNPVTGHSPGALLGAPPASASRSREAATVLATVKDEAPAADAGVAAEGRPSLTATARGGATRLRSGREKASGGVEQEKGGRAGKSARAGLRPSRAATAATIEAGLARRGGPSRARRSGAPLSTAR